MWRPRLNHPCQILCQSVKGFLGGSTPETAMSYTFSNDPYNSSALQCKIASKGVMWGSRDPILEFWDPLLSRQRLKLETSNLAWRRAAVNSNEKNAKLGQKGSCGGHVTQFCNFGTPLISRKLLKLATSNSERRPKAVSSNERKCKIGSKGGHVEVT